MPSPFLSSEEYDDRAHQLYNEGRYDDALAVLRDGLKIYPNAVDLHVGAGYAQLAREEFAWARLSFEQALILEPEHEDALAGLGESLMKLGNEDQALRAFRHTLELGYEDDLDLMLQIGRALFREASLRDRADLFSEALEFFGIAVSQAPENPEAIACQGYARHRLGDDDGAIEALNRAIAVDGEYTEARIYLANILYDRTEYAASLREFDRTSPEDHWDELGIWRYMELKRQLEQVPEQDPLLKPWEERLAELSADLDDVDEMLIELSTDPAEEAARNQLELFGTLLGSLAEQRQDPPPSMSAPQHQIIAQDGTRYDGSWEDIVRRMCDDGGDGSGTLEEFMRRQARRGFRETGIHIPSHDAESFIRGSAMAGLLRIVR